ncbi:MAG: hypothetical protein RRY21_06470 [Oscillospiraceae bacterium]
MRIVGSRNELRAANPPDAELVQTLRCPQCGKEDEQRSPIAMTYVPRDTAQP